ncbi:MAG TPA: hypothetical protein VHA37_00800, partial [Candidatus Saccharimonadales bacterium]|nr:hypothetical protein [Candidatus Saccharimonadales bacterium]
MQNRRSNPSGPASFVGQGSVREETRQLSVGIPGLISISDRILEQPSQAVQRHLGIGALGTELHDPPVETNGIIVVAG